MTTFSVPDYVAALRLSATETEFPLIPACIVTFIHFRKSPVTIEKALIWGKQWVKKDCTLAAVTGRFKRLATKYPSFQLVDGSAIAYKGAVPVSSPDLPGHSVNQAIALLSLERLEKCLPAQYAIAFTRRPLSNAAPTDEKADLLELLERRKVENHRLLGTTGRILRHEYEKKRAILVKELEDLDKEWETPLKILEKELEEELAQWASQKVVPIETVDVEPITDPDEKAVECAQSKSLSRKTKKHHIKAAAAAAAVADDNGTVVPLESSSLSPSPPSHIGSDKKVASSALLAKQKERIRETWQEGTDGASERIRKEQLTSQHVSNMDVCQDVANVVLTCYVLHLYSGLQTMDLGAVPHHRPISARCNMSRVPAAVPSLRTCPVAVA